VNGNGDGLRVVEHTARVPVDTDVAVGPEGRDDLLMAYGAAVSASEAEPESLRSAFVAALALARAAPAPVYDVLSLAADSALGALDDPQVLDLAAQQNRILVTRNSRNLAPLLRNGSEEGGRHAGCRLIWTLAHHEFRAIINGITRQKHEYRDPGQWHDLAVAL
jgi:hypothetical protein